MLVNLDLPGFTKLEQKGNQTTGCFVKRPPSAVDHQIHVPLESTSFATWCMQNFVTIFSDYRFLGSFQLHRCCRFACILFFLIFCSPSSSRSSFPLHSTTSTKKTEGFATILNGHDMRPQKTRFQPISLNFHHNCQRKYPISCSYCLVAYLSMKWKANSWQGHADTGGLSFYPRNKASRTWTSWVIME